ncbi:MAG: protein kinase domain-containing protein [Oscillospiraceae bacterium]
MSTPQAEAYFHGIVEELVHEFSIMFKLKGTANIVSCEDLRVLEHPDGIGWDILIRMELLHPLLPYVYQHPMARRDIIKLGIDICKALELCQRYNIIHRDIKPENIFISDNGDYKLGDFGIARTIERTTSGLSKGNVQLHGSGGLRWGGIRLQR